MGGAQQRDNLQFASGKKKKRKMRFGRGGGTEIKHYIYLGGGTCLVRDIVRYSSF